MNQSLADRIDALLPQTQCARCGFPDCRSYAQAIAEGATAINRCPPGGAKTIDRLAEITGCRPFPLDPACGEEGPRRVALIDEAWCIGCTICLQYCPVDAIVGAPKRMHTVIEIECTGCELCLAPCPVDCIRMVETGAAESDPEIWLKRRAPLGRARYENRRRRLARLRDERRNQRPRRRVPSLAQRKAEIALARARVLERRMGFGAPDSD